MTPNTPVEVLEEKVIEQFKHTLLSPDDLKNPSTQDVNFVPIL
jgi:hypothetical protein